MLRSLFSGIGGLRVHQQMMDITGNNIANVNTAGFKSSNAVFQTRSARWFAQPAHRRTRLAGQTPLRSDSA